jgi:hypothetical protein
MHSAGRFPIPERHIVAFFGFRRDESRQDQIVANAATYGKSPLAECDVNLICLSPMTSNSRRTCEAVPSETRQVADWQAAGPNGHFVQLYRTDEYLIECLAGYVSKGIWDGETVIVIATVAHRMALEERVRTKQVDLATSIIRGQYLALDAREVLAKFMVGDMPDALAFRRIVGEVIRSANIRGKGVRAFGEMVALLWADEKREAAIELERLWNQLAKEHQFSLFCAYPASCASPKDGQPGLKHICDAHTCVISMAS